MKKNITKRSVVFGLAAMLGFAAASAAASTYAWFQTTRVNQLDLSNVKIWNPDAGHVAMTVFNVANGGSRTVGYQPVGNTWAPIPATGLKLTDPTATAAGGLVLHNNDEAAADISGDGRTFYRPNWDAASTPADYSAHSIHTVQNGHLLHKVDTTETYSYQGEGEPGAAGYTPEAGKTYYDTTNKEIYHVVYNEDGELVWKMKNTTYYVQIGLQLQNTADETVAIFLDGDSEIRAASAGTQSKNQAAAKNMRIALWDATLDSNSGKMDFKTGVDNALFTWHQGPGATDEKYGYIERTNDSEDVLYHGLEGYKIHEYDTATEKFLAGAPETITGDMIAESDCPNQYIATLLPNEKKEMIMSMWYEGTMSTSSNAAIEGIIHADIRLAWNFVR